LWNHFINLHDGGYFYFFSFNYNGRCSVGGSGFNGGTFSEHHSGK
jgi:hypothetical protein